MKEKKFSLNKVHEASTKSALQLLKSEIDKVDFIVGVSRGGLVPAAFLSTLIDKPLVAIYVNKTDDYAISCDHLDWLKDKRVLVVDDVIRSGKTIRDIIEFLHNKGIKSVKVFVIAVESTYFHSSGTLLASGFVYFKESLKSGVKSIFPWDY
jgi:hypoxanthine phosphoribosyltransferase